MPVRGKKTVDSRGGSSWQRLLYSPLSRAKQRFQETVVQGGYSFSSLRSSSRVTPPEGMASSLEVGVWVTWD